MLGQRSDFFIGEVNPMRPQEIRSQGVGLSQHLEPLLAALCRVLEQMHVEFYAQLLGELGHGEEIAPAHLCGV
ncbi:MAG TPA: hypothetical protein VNL74_04635 [Methylococcus sp.]|nr:hypothetical protein [Methylococcus sp.]